MLKDDVYEGLRGKDEDKAALVQNDDPIDDALSIFARRVSIAVNFSMLAAKTIVFSYTISMVVLGSMFQSLADIVGQIILASAEYLLSLPPDSAYPVGDRRIETLAVITCAWFMLFFSGNVVLFSVIYVYVALTTEIYKPGISLLLYILLIIGIGLKVALYFYCSYAINHTKNKDLMAALAFDHGYDVLTNTAAIICLLIANNTEVWFLDPLGASLIALCYFYVWVLVLRESQDAVIGKSAPDDFVQEFRDELESSLMNQSQFLGINRCIVYQAGVRYIAEVEIAFDKSTPYTKACDVATATLNLIESREEIERAFVYVEVGLRTKYLHRLDRNYFNQAGDSDSRRTVTLQRASSGGVQQRNAHAQGVARRRSEG